MKKFFSSPYLSQCNWVCFVFWNFLISLGFLLTKRLIINIEVAYTEWHIFKQEIVWHRSVYPKQQFHCEYQPWGTSGIVYTHYSVWGWRADIGIHWRVKANRWERERGLSNNRHGIAIAAGAVLHLSIELQTNGYIDGVYRDKQPRAKLWKRQTWLAPDIIRFGRKSTRWKLSTFRPA